MLNKTLEQIESVRNKVKQFESQIDYMAKDWQAKVNPVFRDGASSVEFQRNAAISLTKAVVEELMTAKDTSGGCESTPQADSPPGTEPKY